MRKNLKITLPSSAPHITLFKFSSKRGVKLVCRPGQAQNIGQDVFCSPLANMAHFGRVTGLALFRPAHVLHILAIRSSGGASFAARADFQSAPLKISEGQV